MVQILLRHHVPEWADEIDFSTLREEPTQLVAKKTLQLRHPDLIWSADMVHGGRVMLLIEFQRTVERLMALRTTTYTALALEGIVGREDFRAGDPLPEFVYLVLYHGDGAWHAPTRVADLFRGSDPGRFRLVSWRKGEGAVDTVLTLRGYPEAMKLGGATTMTEMVDRFRQGLDELVQRGRDQLLHRQVTRRFGEATAGELSDLLDDLTRPEDIDKVTDALIECTTGDDFIERVRIG